MVRNGPPEAVRMMRSTAPACAESKTWKMALCSESTGSSVASLRATWRMTISPAHSGAMLGIDGQQRCLAESHLAHDDIARAHQRLFVGKAHDGAALDGGKRRLEPCRPHDRGHHPV